MDKKYDYIIVGSGLVGSILARELAENLEKKILIVERRNHIAGNTYDYVDKHGIRVQKYGPHVIHTNSEKVYHYVKRFSNEIPFRTKCEVSIDNIMTPSPFNFKTIDQFFKEDAEDLKEKLISYYNGASSVTVVDMLQNDDQDISNYARFLFEKDYKLYTAKQWNISADEIDPSVLKRVPILLSYNDTYFEDKYEFIPKDGFEKLFRNILDHSNIDIQLNTDALKHLSFEKNVIKYDDIETNIIYTGALDELFEHKFGVLPYRSLYFDFQSINVESFQNVPIVAYPQEIGYTRITEYTKMPIQNGSGWTSIAYEYPIPYDRKSKKGKEPYYPVLTHDSQEMYKKYFKYAKKFKNLICCGRLADFKYYNMDQAILRAFEIYKRIKEKNHDSEI